MTANDAPAAATDRDMDTNWNWTRPIAAPGPMAVDFEERVDFDRLRRYRVARTRWALRNSGLGSVLCFDNNNIRYITGSVIGEWSRDKICRYALFTADCEPYLWDFGSAATHHRLFAPWLEQERCKAGMLGLRGSVPEEAGLFKQAAEEIRQLLQREGVADMPVGVDICEPPMLFALQAAGLEVRDGQQVMLDARQIKSMDEIVLLNMSAAIVDGAYQGISEALKPGARENEMVALANKILYESGSDDVEAINAVSGERCSPHPHNFTDRMYRPGDQALLRRHPVVHGLSHLLLPHDQRGLGDLGAAGRLPPRARMDRRRHRHGAARRDHRQDRRAVAQGARVRLRQRDGGLRPAVRPRTGVGPARAPHHQPAGVVRQPVRVAGRNGVRAGDVLPGGRRQRRGADRGEVVVTPDGCRVITLFPAQDLYIANEY